MPTFSYMVNTRDIGDRNDFARIHRKHVTCCTHHACEVAKVHSTKRCQDFPEILAQNRIGTALSWTDLASSPAFVLEPGIKSGSISFYHCQPNMTPTARVQTMQKHCRARFWTQRRARGLELDISVRYLPALLGELHHLRETSNGIAYHDPLRDNHWKTGPQHKCVRLFRDIGPFVMTGLWVY